MNISSKLTRVYTSYITSKSKSVTINHTRGLPTIVLKHARDVIICEHDVCFHSLRHLLRDSRFPSFT